MGASSNATAAVSLAAHATGVSSAQRRSYSTVSMAVGGGGERLAQGERGEEVLIVLVDRGGWYVGCHRGR